MFTFSLPVNLRISRSYVLLCAWCLHDASSYVDVDPGGGLSSRVVPKAAWEEDTHQDANNR